MKAIGIDGNVKKGVFYGILSGVFLIFLNIIGVFSLALPPIASVFSTNVGKLLIVALISPIMEEALFRGVILEKFGRIASAVSFPLFHLVAYSGVVLENFSFEPIKFVLGSFIGALGFGLFAIWLAEKTKSLLPSMIAHAIINFWLVLGFFAVVS